MTRKKKNSQKVENWSQKSKNKNKDKQVGKTPHGNKYSGMAGSMRPGSKQDKKRRGSYVSGGTGEDDGGEDEDDFRGYSVSYDSRKEVITVYPPRSTGLREIQFDVISCRYSVYSDSDGVRTGGSLEGAFRRVYVDSLVKNKIQGLLGRERDRHGF